MIDFCCFALGGEDDLVRLLMRRCSVGFLDEDGGIVDRL